MKQNLYTYLFIIQISIKNIMLQLKLKYMKTNIFPQVILENRCTIQKLGNSHKCVKFFLTK